MIVEEYRCPQSNILYKSGKRCFWYKYSFEQIPIESGYGTIIEIIPISIGSSSFVSLLILTDEGNLESFPVQDVDIEE